MSTFKLNVINSKGYRSAREILKWIKPNPIGGKEP